MQSDKIKRPYMTYEQREAYIFRTILECVEESGVFHITVAQIADRSSCSETLIKKHFGGISSIKAFVIKYAKDHDIQSILNTPITDMIEAS